MRRNTFFTCFSIGLLFLTLCHFETTCWAQEDDSEFNRVRRIYIEGARFMQEKRYVDALPMLKQAYQMLSRSIKKGSKNKRVLRAHKKLRYFIGFCHYQVGQTTQKSKDKKDKETTRQHYEKAVPLLKTFIKTTSSTSRRKKAQVYLATMTHWLANNPRPKKVEKIKKIVIIKKIKEKPKPAGLHPVPLIVMGVGVATALGGVITAFIAQNDISERDKVYKTLVDSGTKEPSAERVAELHREGESLATVSYALWAVGGGIAAVGLVLVFFIKPATPATQPPAMTKNKPKRNHLQNTFQLLGEAN